MLGLLFVPVNIDNSHWTLCVVDFPKKARIRSALLFIRIDTYHPSRVHPFSAFVRVHSDFKNHLPSHQLSMQPLRLNHTSTFIFISALSTWTRWAAKESNVSKAYTASAPTKCSTTFSRLLVIYCCCCCYCHCCNYAWYCSSRINPNIPLPFLL